MIFYNPRENPEEKSDKKIKYEFTTSFHEEWHRLNQASTTCSDLNIQPREFSMEDLREQYFL